MATPVTVKIKFKSPTSDHFVERYSVDVSEGGIFIRTPKPLSVGTSVTFEFQLQDGSPLMAGDGTVVWVREVDPKKASVSPGMGIRFDKLDDHGRLLLEKILEFKEKVEQFSDEPTVAGDPQRALELADAAAAADAIRRSTTGETDVFPGKKPASETPDDRTVEVSQASVARRIQAAEDVGDAAGGADPVSDEPSGEGREESKERLEQLLFAGQEQQAEQAETEQSGMGSDDLPLPVSAAAPMPAEPIAESKSSAVVWMVIVTLLVVGALIFWQWRKRSTPAAKPASKVTAPAPKPAAMPKPAKVSLEVTSDPAGAKVIVDGEDSGQITPATLAELTPQQSITVTLVLPGRKLVTKKVTPGNEPSVKVELTEPTERMVRFTSEPAGATVYLNWKEVGKTPVVLTKVPSAGRRNLVALRLGGYRDVRFNLPETPSWSREGDKEVWTLTRTLTKRVAPARKTAAKKTAAKKTAAKKTAAKKTARKPVKRATRKNVVAPVDAKEPADAGVGDGGDGGAEVDDRADDGY